MLASVMAEFSENNPSLTDNKLQANDVRPQSGTGWPDSRK